MSYHPADHLASNIKRDLRYFEDWARTLSETCAELVDSEEDRDCTYYNQALQHLNALNGAVINLTRSVARASYAADLRCRSA